MVLSCEIRFDQNPHGVYFAGQLLSGSVVLNLDKPKKIKGISLRISGKAQCQWSESHTTGHGKLQRTHTVFYKGREDYIATNSFLVPANSSGSLEIPAGLHTYKFACALPPQLPTSFEGTHGQIRYTLNVVLERPWKFDQTYKVAFTVLREQDLNLESHMLRLPVQMEYVKSFCCGPFRSGPLSVVASVQQTGFVPGQSVRVHTQIINKSNVPIEHLRYTLRKSIAYHSEQPSAKTKFEVETVQERRTGGVPKQSDVEQTVDLVVPAVPPTNTGQCRVIHVTYEVKVEAKTGGMHFSPFVIIPITIGTRPLVQQQQQPYNYNYGFTMPQGDCGVVSASAQPTAPDLATPSPAIIPTSTAPNAADMPPPTYEETMNGNRLIEEEEDTHPIGRKAYTPRYPVYNFNG